MHPNQPDFQQLKQWVSIQQVLSHYGWLGSPKQPISLLNAAGAAVMVIGVLLATYTK